MTQDIRVFPIEEKLSKFIIIYYELALYWNFQFFFVDVHALVLFH